VVSVRRPPRTAAWSLVLLAGLATAGVGVLRATVWAPPATATVRVSAEGSVPVLIAGPEVLHRGRTGVTVRAIGATPQTRVFLGVARTPDAQAVLARVSRATVDGHRLDEVAGDGGQGRLSVAVTPGEPSLPDPAGSDVWAVLAAGPGTARVGWPPDPGSWSLVAASGGSAPAPALELTWAAADGGPGGFRVVGWLAVGTVLTVAGGVALFRTRAAASLALVLLVSACSSGSAGSSSPSGSPGAPAAAGSSAARSPGSGSPSSGSPAPGSTWAPSGLQPYPAVLPGQGERIADAVDLALAAARTALDPGAAGARVVGPERDVLAARLRIAAARHTDARTVATAVGDRLAISRLVVPQAGPWPRWFVVAGTSATAPTPTLRLYLSPDARSPYGLWGQLSLLPGATLPEAAAGATGATTLDPVAGDLAMTPAQVAVRYADVLNRGPASDFAAAFAPDTYRTQLNARLGSDRAAILRGGLATLTSTHGPVPDAVFAVRTADGGALVLLALRQRYVVTVTPGKGAVTADPDLAALAGRSTFSARLDRTASEVLAFRVPAGGRPTQVQLVAAGKADVAASGS
jgi:hypothetical protein